MPKIKEITYQGKHIQFQYMCPGCKQVHAFNSTDHGGVHHFNNDLYSPTISPSLLHSNPQQHRTCHSYITAGKIQFLGDCWHELRDTTVELPDVLIESEEL